MENIDFLLWMLLYPISASICAYISTKEKKIIDGELHSNGAYAFQALINTFIYVVVAMLLF